MTATHVFTLHDRDWLRAQLLDQYRSQGRWRCLSTFTTAPGYRYQLAEWADDLRAVPEDQDDEQRDAGRGHGEADREDDPIRAGRVVALHVGSTLASGI